MKLTYRPLPAIWPSGERTRFRFESRFKAGWNDTLNLLERELGHLGVSAASTVVLETGFSERDIRLDGYPRADARPGDPAVIISFESKYGPLRYGCDTYRTHQDNVRAIALALTALRTVDRYGVTKRGEQYAGWKQLPAAGESTSAREAEAFIRQFAAPGLPLTEAWRTAAKQLHPDVGGSREDWDRLQRAKVAVGL